MAASIGAAVTGSILNTNFVSTDSAAVNAVNADFVVVVSAAANMADTAGKLQYDGLSYLRRGLQAAVA
jgi:hypothetical protein